MQKTTILSYVSDRHGPFEGCILADSLFRIGKRDSDIPAEEVIHKVFKNTGIVCMLVMVPGMTISPSRDPALGYMPATYLDILKIVSMRMPFLKYLLCISGGNDAYRHVYGDWRNVDFRESITQPAEDLAKFMRATYPHSAMIIGGSASVWGYLEDRYATVSHGKLYDEVVEHVVRAMDPYVSTATGATELHGIRVRDRIGHIHHDSKEVFIAAVVHWAKGAFPVNLYAKL